MTQNRDKEQAFPDFLQMIRASWTYEKMTEDEQRRIEHELKETAYPFFDGRIRGSYENRFRELNNIYSAFLAGLGYSGPHWRES